MCRYKCLNICNNKPTVMGTHAKLYIYFNKAQRDLRR